METCPSWPSVGIASRRYGSYDGAGNVGRCGVVGNPVTPTDSAIWPRATVIGRGRWFHFYLPLLCPFPLVVLAALC